MSTRRLLVALLLSAAGACQAQEPLSLTILHTNDLHAHPEPTTMGGQPYGGYARLATLIQRARAEDKNNLLLNAGDCFQGTLYFNAYEGLVECAFMNAVKTDAMCVGNHEFDRGPQPLATFARNAAFPVLGANLDMTREPLLRDRIKPYTILKVDGQQIGVIGLVTPDTPNISSPGPNLTFLELAPTVNKYTAELKAAGVNKIMLLTHIGYSEDMQLASAVRDVDVIVGGHSHSPLGTPALDGWPNPRGPYPTVVKGGDGKDVAIVQAYEWGKVLGRFKVSFDAAGNLQTPVTGSPIVADATVPEDPLVASMMAAFKKPIEAMANERIGEAAEPIERNSSGESTMANIIADSMLVLTRKAGSKVAFVNTGGVRSGIDAGPITYGEAIAVSPFGNTLVLMDLTGADLMQVLEQGAPGDDKIGGMMNPSKGSSYAIDFTKPAGSRIHSVIIDGEPVDLAKTYRMTFNSFSASGGDSHFYLRDLKGYRLDTGTVDVEALIDYIKANSPIAPKLEGRLKVNG